MTTNSVQVGSTQVSVYSPLNREGEAEYALEVSCTTNQSMLDFFSSSNILRIRTQAVS